MAVTIDYCGEIQTLTPGSSITIGREGDVRIDDNPFLHRHFLTLTERSGFWVVSNVGTQLAATVSDESGQMEAFLAPGASLPIVFEQTRIAFTAGPTSYELSIVNDDVAFHHPPTVGGAETGATTVGPPTLTTDQFLLIVALSEARLNGDGRGATTLPSSVEAALRLGWTTTKFNRKLDNVCDKLTKLGVRGLHGTAGDLASSRRARLVEYAVATRLVTKADVGKLDREIVDPQGSTANGSGTRTE